MSSHAQAWILSLGQILGPAEAGEWIFSKSDPTPSWGTKGLKRIPLKFFKLGMRAVMHRKDDAKEKEQCRAHLTSLHAELSCAALTQV